MSAITYLPIMRYATLKNMVRANLDSYHDSRNTGHKASDGEVESVVGKIECEIRLGIVKHVSDLPANLYDYLY